MKQGIWLITGGAMQKTAAQKILSSGFALILSDRNPAAVCVPLADLFLPIDTFDVDAHLRAADDVKKKFNIQAVMTFAADCHYTVAVLAKHLNLHGIDPQISKICRDKIKTREILTAAGIYQPLSYMVSSYEKALAVLAKHKNISFVIKAPDSSGSRGFQVLDKTKLLSREQFEYTKSFGSNSGVILEERLIADPAQISEASVETLWVDGKMYWINWVDRIFPADLKFFPMINIPFQLVEGIEVGHINPARHEYSVKKQVEESMKKAGYALGMHHQKGGHILKGDIFFSMQGPVILEMTPRSSGGWDSSGTSLARGADLPGGILHIAQGKEVNLEDWYRYFHYHDDECTAVVLSKIKENAVDCIGRQFTLVSGYGETAELIQIAFKQLKEEKYVSI